MLSSKLSRRRVFLFALFWILFLFVKCPSTGTDGDRLNPPPEQPNSPGGNGTDGPAGAGQGPSGNNPADFPTIANLNFAAFPQDPGNTCPGTNVYHVSTGGNDNGPGSQAQPFRTIAKALHIAQSGDAVIVHGGNYQERYEDGDFRSLAIERPNIYLCATSGETVTVSGASDISYGMDIGSEHTVVNGINFSSYPNGIHVHANNVVLKNLTVTAGGNTFKNGIFVEAAAVDKLLLENVTVKNANLGISCNVGPCKDWRLDRVAVQNDPSTGDTGADAIALENGDNVLISNVEVTGAPGDGIDSKATRIAVFNANVHNNSRNGIKFWRGGDLVNSFVVSHDADAAVVFDGAGAYRILNSLIAYENWPQGGSYTMGTGYDLPADPITLAIINSVFFNNAGAVWVSGATDVTLQNCLFTPTVEGEIFVKGNQTVVNSDAVSALQNVATASGNLAFSSNPLYTNPPQDFHFPNNSPLKDAGTTPALFPSYDFKGETRILGNAPDLGPLELF